MGIGSSMRDGVTAVINSIGSTVTITSYVISTSDSGYSGQSETDGAPVTETAVPFGELKEISKQKFGDLEIGGFQLALKSSATFKISGDTKYKIIYNEEEYDISKVQRFFLDDTLIAWIINLDKRLN